MTFNMALEIITVPTQHVGNPSPPTILPAPGSTSAEVLPVRTDVNEAASGASDSDSGRWSILDDDLPLSDNVSCEEFSSASTFRRGSFTDNVPPLVPAVQAAYAATLDNDEYDADDLLYDIRLDLLDDLDEDVWYRTDMACIVCYEQTYAYDGSTRSCCHRPVCKDCMMQFVQVKVGDGVVYIECPNPDCDAPVGKQEILQYLTGEEKERYERMRLEVDGDGNKKACPNCSFITEHELPKLKLKMFQEEDVKIKCIRCDQEWCFDCHAPWHKDISCKEFRKGDQPFKKWTKGWSHTGTANCQKCPTCRVFIQRSTGCDHMTCNRCDTHFCYMCGGRFTFIPGLGGHYDPLSILGCKHNYKKHSPLQRKAIRGGYLGAKLAMLTGYPVLFAGGAAIMVAAGIVILPIYGGYRLYKLIFKKNSPRHRQRRHH